MSMYLHGKISFTTDAHLNTMIKGRITSPAHNTEMLNRSFSPYIIPSSFNTHLKKSSIYQTLVFILKLLNSCCIEIIFSLIVTHIQKYLYTWLNRRKVNIVSMRLKFARLVSTLKQIVLIFFMHNLCNLSKE